MNLPVMVRRTVTSASHEYPPGSGRAPLSRPNPEYSMRMRSASAGMRSDRTSRLAAPANALSLRRPASSAEPCRPPSRPLHGREQWIQPRDARGKEPRARPAQWSCGRYLAALYNTVHPHKALGYRSLREFRKQLVEKTTENAVGAGRRPHEGATATEAIGSRPTAAQRAVARSASLDAGAAVDHP